MLVVVVIFTDGSHSCVQRPFPLEGRFMANLFCHFEPTGQHIDEEGNYYWKDGKVDTTFPPYIIRGSPQEAEWRSEFPEGWEYDDPWEEGEEEDDEEWHDDDEYEWDEHWEEQEEL